MPPQLQTFESAKQQQLDQLLEKNAEGAISSQEKAELDSLVAEAEQLMVANARKLIEFTRYE